MCGIAGFIDLKTGLSADERRAVLERMLVAIHHRGPDDRGGWHDDAAGVSLGMTRLAIVDLSPTGRQPMTSSDGRWTVVFNGEIYNHRALRKPMEAAGVRFRGTSDTETLVESFARRGIEATIAECVGMFGLAAWDAHRRELTLIRDRMGKKPLYYGWQNGALLFGSELKSLRRHPAFANDVDRNVVPLYLKHNYVPAPYSIYRGIRKLAPGGIIVIRPGEEPHARESIYWSIDRVLEQSAAQPFRGSYDEACNSLDALLSDAVGLRMLADVPVGAFLSGGIDSSLIVALMQRASSRPVRTFSIGFEEKAYDEAPFARQVAAHLGTDHVEHYVTARESLDVIPKLPTLYDEPFADSSQIPTYLVCAAARREVTVALSGDGGDELFCGYRRYFEPLRFSWISDWLPGPLRALSASVLGRMATQAPPGFFKRNLGRASRVIAARGADDWYVHGLTHWPEDLQAVLNASPAPTRLIQRDWPRAATQQGRWMALDAISYLPDDILVKVDRASMGVSLEARTPLLDHRVVEFAWSLPPEFKAHNWTGKRILRDLLARHVPRSMFERPKTGFGVPIDSWLRGPLRDWAESLIAEDRLRREGWFNVKLVRSRWEEHRTGQRDWHYLLWDVLMFQAWLDAQA